MKRLPGKIRTLRGRIIVSSLAAAVLPLLISIVVLIMVVYYVLAPFIQSEVDFAMRETGGNMNTKTVYLEDILLSLRADEEVMDAMRYGGLSGENPPIEDTVKRLVNLYSNKNTDWTGIPFLDMAYVFDRQGNFCSTSYIDYVTGTKSEIDARYLLEYRAFQASGTDVAIRPTDEHLNICYVLYDDEMKASGTLIFAVNLSAVHQIMGKADQYQDGFWFLWDDSGIPVLTGPSDPLTPQEHNAVTAIENHKPYNLRIGKMGYRIYSTQLGAGLSVTVGVSDDQLFLLLLDSVKFYLIIPLLLLPGVGVLLFYRVMYLTKPLAEVAKSLQLVAEKDFSVRLPQYDSQEFSTISTAFNTMTETIDHLVNDIYEKKLLAMHSELQFLQSQMNPHFMYNVLNTIALKAKLDNNQEVYEMASNFAGLTQARLHHRGDDKITVEQELQLVCFYLNLQKSRFEDKLAFFISVQNDQLLRCRVPKLCVEFIVENAVLHGIEPKAGPGTVYIDICREEKALLIRVEDDGVGFPGTNGNVSIEEVICSVRKEGHNHIALENVTRMIRLFYGESYGVNIQSRENVGTMVTIRIPIDMQEEEKEDESDVSGNSGR